VFISSNNSRQHIGKNPVTSIHAEIGVLMQFLKENNIYNINHVVYKNKNKKKKIKKLHNSTLYIVRNSIRQTNDFIGHVCGLSMPCRGCQKYLIMHGVGTIKYTEYKDGVNVLHTMKLINKLIN
jgi:hypothetical protein